MRITNAKLELYLRDLESPELIKTVFDHPKLERKMIAFRTTGLVPKGVGSFKWSQCSKALALFFVKAKLILKDNEEAIPILDGYRLSPASSLGSRLWKVDYTWIHDVFGTDSRGVPLLSQLILGINVRQSTKEPVQIFLRTNVLPIENIAIFLDDEEITNNPSKLKTLTNHLTSQWAPRVSKFSPVNSIEEKLVA